ncbi:hypothetical protein [Lentzea sp. NPDC003310]|uniref:hypothetical protein n=1 Tax=Lentzea sp. NPDC003310 TaxID=3154447 RepID=UPI0033A22FD5
MIVRRAWWSVALHRRDGKLWLRHWRRWFALEPGMTAELSRLSYRRRLLILSGGAVVWSCTYLHEPRDWPTIFDFDFSAADPEDYDFGLMVLGMLAEPHRFERCLAGGNP